MLKINKGKGKGREIDNEILMRAASKIDQILTIAQNHITAQPVSDLSPLSTCKSPNAQHTSPYPTSTNHKKNTKHT